MSTKSWPPPTDADKALISIAGVLLALAAIGGVILAVGS